MERPLKEDCMLSTTPMIGALIIIIQMQEWFKVHKLKATQKQLRWTKMILAKDTNSLWIKFVLVNALTILSSFVICTIQNKLESLFVPNKELSTKYPFRGSRKVKNELYLNKFYLLNLSKFTLKKVESSIQSI